MFKLRVMMENILSQMYYDPSSPASYGGKEAVYKAAKALHPNVTQRKMTTSLSKQSTSTMHKPVRRYHFKTNRVFAEGIDYQWQAGLTDLGSVQTYNDGFQYLLTCIDVFSKYAWAIPLRNKIGTTLVSTFKTIFCRAIGNQHSHRLMMEQSSRIVFFKNS